MTTQSEPLKPINYDKLRKDYLRDMAEIEGKEVIKTPETLETPSELEILWKRLNRQGIYCHMPIKWTEFEQAIERLIADVIGEDEKLPSKYRVLDGEHIFADKRNELRAEQRQRLAQLSNTKGEQSDETN